MRNRISCVTFVIAAMVAISASWLFSTVLVAQQDLPPCNGATLEPAPGSPCEDGGGMPVECWEIAETEQDCSCFPAICQNPPDGEPAEIWDCCDGPWYRVDVNVQHCLAGDPCVGANGCVRCDPAACGWAPCYTDRCCIWDFFDGCVEGGEACASGYTHIRMNYECEICQLALHGTKSPVVASSTPLLRNSQR